MDALKFISLPPTDEACDRDQKQMLELSLPTVAPTCPSCDGHNVSDATGLGRCGDCGLTDNLSGFMGGGMTANARFQPSKYGNSSAVVGDARKVRAFTISGNVD
jgi:hypothetical protein